MQKILKDVIKASNLLKLYLPSLYGGFKNRKLFEGVKTYCMFIGYPKSGHSLIGALLDLDDCANIVYKTPHKSRYDTQWSRELIDIVKNRMEKYPFLNRYSYED